MYDYLIVGSGLLAASLLMKCIKRKILPCPRTPSSCWRKHLLRKQGWHQYPYLWRPHFPHVEQKVWDYVNQFVEFNNYVNSPVANYKGELYNLPLTWIPLRKCGALWHLRKRPKRLPSSAPKQASRIQKSRRTGHFPYRDGHLYEAHQRLYGKAMGEKLQGAASIHH